MSGPGGKVPGRSANRPPGLYAPQLGGRIWAGNSLCTTPLGPPDQDPSGVSGSHAPGGLAGCVTANLTLFPVRPHEKWGAGKFIFRAIRKTPSEIGLHTRTNGAHQPDDPQRRREKRHGRFRAISEHLPTGAPVRGFEHGQPTRGPAWRCMWPLCSPGPGGWGRPGWGSVVRAWHAPHALPMRSLRPARLVALPETQPHLTRAHTAMKRAAGGTGRGLCMHMAGD